MTLRTLGSRALSITGVTAGAITLLLGTATSVTAEENAILVPGAFVCKQINPLYPEIAATYPNIGKNFHVDADAQLIDYSQNFFAAGAAIADGVAETEVAVNMTEGPVAVVGESMGSMVASRLAKSLAQRPDPPLHDQIRFVLIAPPEAGIARYFPVGTYIPVLNYIVSRVPETSYDTIVVIGEYDGWADPPDRPWNLIASANALLGINIVHGPPSFAADPATVPPENITVSTNSEGGTVTTYLIPTENLPLTQPLRSFGVPDLLVDQVDEVLRPIIDSAYLRHDEPGDRRPYFSDGKIQANVQGRQSNLGVQGQKADLEMESQAAVVEDQQADFDVQGRHDHRNVQSQQEARQSGQGEERGEEGQERGAEHGQESLTERQEGGDERQDGGTERQNRAGDQRQAQSTEPRSEGAEQRSDRPGEHHRKRDTEDTAA